jgi:hypothetical protein
MRVQIVRSSNEPLSANAGGPQSRQRTETLKGSFLGNEEGLIRCPLVLQLGLDFEGVTSKVAFITGLLQLVGLTHPQELVGRFQFPATRLLARPTEGKMEYLSVLDSPVEEVLEQALLLGLCTAFLFDPYRPVLWTETSLSRRLDLFQTEGFYA